MRCPTLPGTRRGFSLLELMVVIVLLGVIVTTTTLSIDTGGSERELREAGDRLTALLRMARDEAVIRSEEWAIVIKEDGYGFELQELAIIDGEPKVTRKPIEDRLFRPRKLDNMRLSLMLENAQLNVDEEDEEGIIARVFILSSGEMTEAELRLGLENEDAYYLIKTTPQGDITLENPDEV